MTSEGSSCEHAKELAVFYMDFTQLAALSEPVKGNSSYRVNKNNGVTINVTSIKINITKLLLLLLFYLRILSQM